MRNLTLAAFAAVALGVALTGSAANAQLAPGEHKKTIGYQDDNGTFHPLPVAMPDVVTSQTFTGAIKVVFTITPKTSLPSGTKVYCGVSVIATSENELAPTAGPITYAEGAAVIESSTTSCTVEIPYSWVLNPPAATTVNEYSGTYYVVAVNASSPTVVGETTGIRSVSGPFVGGAKMPANGATTIYTVAATL
jgi:hypothetical protein